MITSYSSFIDSPNLFELSEGVRPKYDINTFSSLFDNSLFESKKKKALLEKAYYTYELGLLYESRKSWFQTPTPIYMLEGDQHNLLFKDNSLFIISKNAYQFLNEQLFDGWREKWDQVTTAAKETVNQVATSAKKQWDDLSDGAKKAYEFSERIVSAAAKFVTENPLVCAGIFLQLMSGLTAFIPGVGQVAGPVMLGIAGVLEIYEGVSNMREAWEKFSGMNPSNIGRSVESFKAGGPLVIAGLVSLCLGLNDVITAPKAAVPLAGPTSTVLHTAANRWSSTFAAKITANAEHCVANVFGKGAKNIATSLEGPVTTFMEKGGTGLAAAAVSTLFVSVGKNILGSLFDSFLVGLKAIADFFDTVLSIPSKISDVFSKLINSAESPLAKILITPLKTIINPIVGFIGKLMNTYIRPITGAVSKFISVILKESNSLKDLANQLEVQIDPVVKKSVATVKPNNVTVKKEDVQKVKDLKKSNESLIIKLEGF